MRTSDHILGDGIATLFRSQVATVQRVVCPTDSPLVGPEGTVDDFHIVVPQRGAFTWHRPCGPVLADPAQALLVPGGERYAISHPGNGDHSIVLTPTRKVARKLGFDLLPHYGPVVMAPAVAYRFKLIAEMSLAGTPAAVLDGVIGETLQWVRNPAPGRGRVGAEARRTLNRAKAFIAAAAPDELALADVAAAVGVTAIYLTQLFKKVEGVALHRYVSTVRMNAAVSRLADCDDITSVALDHGYSSHSHFSTACRAALGSPPSRVRETLRAIRTTQRQPGAFVTRRLCAARAGGRAA